MNEPENPPAFPGLRPERNSNGIKIKQAWFEGMSLRDYLAGQVVAGANWASSKASPKEAAFHAYAVADAMLEERLK